MARNSPFGWKKHACFMKIKVWIYSIQIKCIIKGKNNIKELVILMVILIIVLILFG